MRIVMEGRKYELFKIIEPYLCTKNGKMAVNDDAPENVKKAYEEFITIPLEPEVY